MSRQIIGPNGWGIEMVDLIQALIQVKTPLTLFAFLSLIFLAAFTTKRVPELFFGLLKDKLTRGRFAQLLHRFIVLGFVAFGLVCAVAVVGQVLAYKVQSQSLGVNELRDELKKIDASESQRQAALEAYADGLAKLKTDDLAGAVQALQKSIDAIPTLSAQTTLAYLYQRQGNKEEANKYAASALKMATLSGDSVAQARLQGLTTSPGGSESSGMIGDKKPLPEGGKSFEEAVTISPGLYMATRDVVGDELKYYKMHLKAGQTLLIEFRHPDYQGGGYVTAAIYDADGGLISPAGALFGRSQLGTVRWTAPKSDLFYLSVGLTGNVASAVYRISIQ
jgi:tetratricopeptide (TPR) repeat protein